MCKFSGVQRASGKKVNAWICAPATARDLGSVRERAKFWELQGKGSPGGRGEGGPGGREGGPGRVDPGRGGSGEKQEEKQEKQEGQVSSRVCVCSTGRVLMSVHFLLSRLRATAGLTPASSESAWRKGGGRGGGGGPPPFPHRTLSSHSLDLSSRGLPADATRPQQPT